jgi:tripartite-type tricarboxylate transporter receptor subunit TctC
MRKAIRVTLGFLIAALTACTSIVSAQDYPNRPIRLIIGSGPGSTTDLVARLLADSMSQQFGHPVVVEGKPGAGGLVAADYVTRSVAPDGYTLLLSPNDIASYGTFMKGLEFDPLRDIPPISVVAEGSQLVTTNSMVPFTTFKEMVAYAKANPGKLNYASSSAQSLATIVFEDIRQKEGIDIVMIPYKGASAQWRPALLVNEVQLTVNGERSALGDGDKVRVLAATGDTRLAAFPNAPTFTELGYPELVGYSFALHAPARTPKPVVDKLYAAVQIALKQPQMREKLTQFGLQILGLSPEESARKLAAESETVAAIAQKAGIRAQ